MRRRTKDDGGGTFQTVGYESAGGYFNFDRADSTLPLEQVSQNIQLGSVGFGRNSASVPCMGGKSLQPAAGFVGLPGRDAFLINRRRSAAGGTASDVSPAGDG